MHRGVKLNLKKCSIHYLVIVEITTCIIKHKDLTRYQKTYHFKMIKVTSISLLMQFEINIKEKSIYILIKAL